MENEMNPNIQKYLDKIEVQIEEAKAIKDSKKEFSGTTDSKGNQYVNLVQEGGSVLGLAHVGYTYILETAGIRFWRLAGTSAGAINAIMLAAIDSKSDMKSEKMLGYIAEKNFIEFVDGPKWLPDVLKKTASNSGYMLNLVIFMMGIFILAVINLIFLSIYHTPIYAKFVYFLLIVSLVLTLMLLSIWFIFKKLHWGINPGNAFRTWLHNILKCNNAETLGKLKKTAYLKAENLKLKYPNDAKKEVPFSTSDINMITTNLTDKKKVNLPLQASDYGWDDSSNVADFVRCSMSIPFFFSPFIHKYNERDIYFVDGGALSNFPINIFHNQKVKNPRLPVFGVKLDSLIVKENSFTLVKYVVDLIETLKSYGDKEFLEKNTFYEKHCVKVVDTSGFNSLNFSMDENEKIELFALGARAAIEFLNGFDWKLYKMDRALI